MMREITALLRRGLIPSLTATESWKTLEAFGQVLDDQLERAREALSLRFPNYDGRDETLALIGDDRVLPRGLEEPAESYAERLRAWLDTHRTRGNPYTLVENVAAFYTHSVGEDLVVKLVDRSGNKFTWEDGEIVRSTEDMTSQDLAPGLWARWFLFVYAGDIDDPSETDATRVPIIFNAGHVSEGTVTLLRTGEHVWDEPDLEWGDDADDDAPAWGDDEDLQQYGV